MSSEPGMLEGRPITPVSALDYYTNVKNYGEPWVTKHSRHNMVGCMHPSCEVRRQQRNKVQSPGGGYGVMTDRQIAEIVLTGRVLTDEEAVDVDYEERNTSDLDIHEGCAFWLKRFVIVKMMAQPSARVLETFDRWNEDYYHKDGITPTMRDEAIGASGILLAQLTEGDQTDNPELMAHFDRTFDGKNVLGVEDIEDPVEMYVVSHAVNIVQQQKYRRHKVTPMAYFDTPGALTNLTRDHDDDRSTQTADLMNTSNLLRSVSARDVIAGGKDMTLLEVRRDGKKLGFDIVEL